MTEQPVSRSSDLQARFDAVGVDIEAHEDDIERDAKGCNCDVDYQCFNIECREHNWRRAMR